MSIITILVSILIFGALIFVHEFGHFIAAKSFGVTVEEFSMGMGPKLLSKEKNGTVYSLRLFPIGGFCAMKGEDAGDYEKVVVDGKEKKVYPKGSLNSVSVGKRMVIMAAGAFMNFLSAFIIFVVTFALIGTTPTTTMHTVYENTPAYEAGIRAGDTILTIDNKEISTWEDISSAVSSSNAKEMTIVLKGGDSATRTVMVTAQKGEDGSYKIGISPTYSKNPVDVISTAAKSFGSFFPATFDAIAQIISGKAGTDTLMGPIGVVSFIDSYISYGALTLLNIAASLSMSIGLFNLLPIPALDGSRILFLFVELIKGSPIDPEKEGMVHFVGFVLLMILAVFIAFQDIMRIVK